jgi:hypothetical protein
MPRIARVVVSGLPQHVTQRGVRSLDVFDDDGDCELYLKGPRRNNLSALPDMPIAGV